MMYYTRLKYLKAANFPEYRYKHLRAGLPLFRRKPDTIIQLPWVLNRNGIYDTLFALVYAPAAGVRNMAAIRYLQRCALRSAAVYRRAYPRDKTVGNILGIIETYIRTGDIDTELRKLIIKVYNKVNVGGDAEATADVHTAGMAIYYAGGAVLINTGAYADTVDFYTALVKASRYSTESVMPLIERNRTYDAVVDLHAVLWEGGEDVRVS